MQRYFLLLGGLICAASPGLFASGIDATATFTDSLVSPGVYQYDFTLNNTGTTTIGTFWLSWIPFDNFMPVSPTSIVTPTGWQEVITSGGPSNGFAIQWIAKAPADDLAAGGSLSGFDFDSTLTPAQLESPASGNPFDPVDTAFLYSGGPFSGSSAKIVATAATPEPSATLSIAFGLGFMVFCSHILRRHKLTPNP